MLQYVAADSQLHLLSVSSSRWEQTIGMEEMKHTLLLELHSTRMVGRWNQGMRLVVVPSHPVTSFE